MEIASKKPEESARPRKSSSPGRPWFKAASAAILVAATLVGFLFMRHKKAERTGPAIAASERPVRDESVTGRGPLPPSFLTGVSGRPGGDLDDIPIPEPTRTPAAYTDAVKRLLDDAAPPLLPLLDAYRGLVCSCENTACVFYHERRFLPKLGPSQRVGIDEKERVRLNKAATECIMALYWKEHPGEAPGLRKRQGKVGR